VDTVVVTIRLERAVYLKILEKAGGKGHTGGAGSAGKQGGVSKYIRDRITYDTMRKHGKGV